MVTSLVQFYYPVMWLSWTQNHDMILLSGYAILCKMSQSFLSIYSRYAVQILLEILMSLYYIMFQMASRPQNQVVRLTRCLDVPGHTAMLVRVMTEAGYRWYPEYMVEEQFRDFNQS